MDKIYCFGVGALLGLGIAFLVLGRLWLGLITLAIPVGIVSLLVGVVALLVLAEGDWQHVESDGYGDGWKN